MLVQAAHGAVKKKRSFYQSKYHKLRYRLGSANKAKVAIANRIARSIYKVLGGEAYKELGYRRAVGDERRIKNMLTQLKLLGVDVRYERQELIAQETVRVNKSGVAL